MTTLAEEVLKFIRLLEIEEESEDGRSFRPNKLSSCRAVDCQKMNDLLVSMKQKAIEASKIWQD
jgi:hypothetical protein